MIKSPLRYPGGKQKIIKYLLSNFSNFEEYREPFLGGGSVFLYLKQVFPHKRYWINDKYKRLYLFWKIAKDNPSDLVNKILYWKNIFGEENGKKLYDYVKSFYDSDNEVEIAASFFILNRITFSGLTDSGGYSGSASRERFTTSSIKKIMDISPLLNDVKITNSDYEEVVLEKGKRVLIYLDPPYYIDVPLYGKRGNVHKNFDHLRLANVLKKISHKWLLSYNNDEYIKELYSFAHCIEIEVPYSIINRKRSIELLISNYSLKEMSDEELHYSDIF